MRNVWKGLVVGALTGMAGGLAMDIAAGGRDKAGDAVSRVLDKAPSAARAATRKATAVLADADLPDRVRDAADHVAGSQAAKELRRRAGAVS